MMDKDAVLQMQAESARQRLPLTNPPLSSQVCGRIAVGNPDDLLVMMGPRFNSGVT